MSRRLATAAPAASAGGDRLRAVLQAGEARRAQLLTAAEAALLVTGPSIDQLWTTAFRRLSLPSVRWGKRRSKPETLSDVVKFTQAHLKTLKEIADRSTKAAAEQFPDESPQKLATFGVYSPEDARERQRIVKELMERFLPIEGSVVPGQGQEDRTYRSDIHKQIISATLYSTAIMAEFSLETRVEFLLWARENHLEATQTVVRNAVLESTDPAARPVQGIEQGVKDTIQSWFDAKVARERAGTRGDLVVNVVQLVAHAGEAVYW